MIKAGNINHCEVEVEIINMVKVDLRTCVGCRICFDKGEEKCPGKDDLLDIKKKMMKADAWIFASPVYVNDVNGIMKNLIDRLAHICHRPEFGGKAVFLLATTGSTPTKHAMRTMELALWTWGCATVGRLSIMAGALTDIETIRKNYQSMINKAAKQFLSFLLNQRCLKPSFIQLMIFRIQQEGWSRANKDSIDYKYWLNKGWLDLKTTFFFSHKQNRLVTDLARLVGEVAIPIFAPRKK